MMDLPLSQVSDNTQSTGPELRSCTYVAFMYSSLISLISLNSLQARVNATRHAAKKQEVCVIQTISGISKQSNIKYAYHSV